MKTVLCINEIKWYKNEILYGKRILFHRFAYDYVIYAI